MIHAYQEIYVNKVQKSLGTAFDYAINTCGILGDEFIKLFIVSSISKRIKNGEPLYLVGKTGIEIVFDIISETKYEVDLKDVEDTFDKSCEYWIGWSIAYCQWYSDRSFNEIFEVFSYDELRIMYQHLHEADISKFVEIVDSRIKEYYHETNLKRMRKLCGYTQKEVAENSGVSLRCIQMYEERNKDINKASVETLYKLSKVFGCKIEDLIEK